VKEIKSVRLPVARAFPCTAPDRGGRTRTDSPVTVVTRRQLSSLGVSDAEIRRSVRQGTLVRVARGVYAAPQTVLLPGSTLVVREMLALAAALATTAPGAVGSHETAALIYGLDLLRRESNGRVTLTRPPSAAGSRSGAPRVHMHAAELPSKHRTQWRGLQMTTPARTVVDIARVRSLRAGVVVADSALRSRMTTKAELASVLEDCSRWRGIRRAREAISFSDARSESALESLGRVVIHEQGLPAPELQAWVGDTTDVIGRADFLWKPARTIGEADGLAKYENPSRAIDQLRRDARLRDAGFEVVHFTWEEITQTPEQVTARLKAAFKRGGCLRT
jgi:hypothetical protein